MLGTALSVVIGAVGGILVSATWWQSSRRRRRAAWLAPWLGARATLAVPRAIHEVVWGLMLLSVLGLDPMVAVLAIGLPFGAVTAKVFAEILDDTPHEPFHALHASGATRSAAIAYGLLPHALPDLLSYSFYRLECAIRSAAILGLVGAGGIGFEIALSFQALRYDEMWTMLYALVLLCGVADLWSSIVRARRGRVISVSAVAAGALVPWASWQVSLDPSVLWSGEAVRRFQDMATAAWPPSLGGASLGDLITLSLETITMAVIAIAISFAGAVLLAFPAARELTGTSHRSVGHIVAMMATRAILLVFRAVPPPVWALICVFVMFPGILPGAVALGIYNLGVLGRLMAEAVETLNPHPWAALRAIGASSSGAFTYGVLPAAFPRFVAYGLYRWEVIIRETVIVGVVGAGGLGLLLQDQLARFDYAAVTSTLVALIVMTLLVDFASAALRRGLS